MDMIERVARALCVAVGSDPDWTGYQSGPADDARPMWQRREKEVRAAIEALREPTGAMIDAAYESALAEDAAGVWREMIAAALNQDTADD